MKNLVIAAGILLSTAALAAGALTTKATVKGKDNRGSFNITYVQLTAAIKNKAGRLAVNKDVKKTALSYICEANPKNHKNMESNIAMQVSYVSQDLLGISYTTDYFCNGAYPDHTPMGAIYSIRTGKPLDVEKEVRDEAALRRLVVEKVMANLPKGDDAVEDCNQMYGQDEFTAGYYTYVLKNGALTVSPDYPHVAQACGFDTDISLNDLKPLLKEGSDLLLAK
jgi:hypothetical protein